MRQRGSSYRKSVEAQGQKAASWEMFLRKSSPPFRSSPDLRGRSSNKANALVEEAAHPGSMEDKHWHHQTQHLCWQWGRWTREHGFPNAQRIWPVTAVSSAALWGIFHRCGWVATKFCSGSNQTQLPKEPLKRNKEWQLSHLN